MFEIDRLEILTNSAQIYLSPFPSVVTNFRMAGARRVTRKYEAGRRNGHYNDTPPRSGGGVSKASAERAFSRVKRKLQFGRKPPQKRDVTPTASTSSRASKKKSKTKASALTRELRNLLDFAVVLPVRLRSAMRRATGKEKQQAGYRLKATAEGTNLSRTKRKGRRSKEVITKKTLIN